MRVRVSLERWQDVVRLMVPLFHEHWEEVGLGTALEMDYRAYSKLAASGGLLCVCVWAEARLVGYWTLLLSPFLHQRSIRAAHTDLLFVQKEFRSGATFRALFRRVEKELLTRSVELWFVGEKLRRPIGPLLTRYGFSPEEQSWVKRLEKENG